MRMHVTSRACVPIAGPGVAIEATRLQRSWRMSKVNPELCGTVHAALAVLLASPTLSLQRNACKIQTGWVGARVQIRTARAGHVVWLGELLVRLEDASLLQQQARGWFLCPETHARPAPLSRHRLALEVLFICAAA